MLYFFSIYFFHDDFIRFYEIIFIYFILIHNEFFPVKFIIYFCFYFGFIFVHTYSQHTCRCEKRTKNVIEIPWRNFHRKMPKTNIYIILGLHCKRVRLDMVQLPEATLYNKDNSLVLISKLVNNKNWYEFRKFSVPLFLCSLQCFEYTRRHRINAMRGGLVWFYKLKKR